MKRLNGQPRNHPGKPRGPIRTNDPITRAVLEAVEKSGMHDYVITKRAGINKNEISSWRIGQREPKAYRLSYVLEVIGAHIEIIDNNDKRAK